MAIQIISKLIDDIDGSEATETVTFAIDGTAYTIDLNAEHAARLRAAIEPYRAKASRSHAGKPGRPHAATSTRRTPPTITVRQAQKGDPQVWMAAQRKGLAYHPLNGGQTVCERHVGNPDAPTNGIVVSLSSARDIIGGLPCVACHKVKPTPTAKPGKPAKPGRETEATRARKWARDHNFERVGVRGRLRPEVMEAYRRSGGK